MRPVTAFLLINLVAFALYPFVAASPRIEEYRPREFQPGQEAAGSVAVFKYLLWMTAALVALKLIRFRLVWLIDLSVFLTGYIFGSLFRAGLPLGLLLLYLRKRKEVRWFNLSSAGTIVAFALLLAKFVTPKAAMLLLALLSIYDVVGVLWLPYIKFLWLETGKIDPKWFEAVALVFDEGMVGAGDFTLPLLFSLSFGLAGLASVPLLAAGFWLNQLLARRLGAFPGIPFQAFFAYLFYIALA